MSDSVAAYIARQAATVGRQARPAEAAHWAPCLPGATDACLGLLRHGEAAVQGGQAPCVAIHPQGQLLLTGGSDGAVRCWKLATGLLLWESNERHAARIHDIAVSPSGQRLATASYDQTLRFWSARDGHCLHRYERHQTPSYQLTWSVRGHRLAAACGDNIVRIWDTRGGKGLLRCRGHQEMVWSVTWSPDDRWLASGSADRTIRLWDPGNGNCVRELHGHGDWVVAVSWSPNGRWLASLGNDHTIRLWDTQTWNQLACWEAHPEASFLKDLVWSPDSRWLASAARGGPIELWEASAGRHWTRYSFPEDSAWRLAWSQDGAFLASSHSGDIFRLWDTRALTVQAAPVSASLPSELAMLPTALVQLHRLRLYPPLSLLYSLLRLTGGQTDVLPELAALPGVRGLIQLRWPVVARVGLAALLLRELPPADWHPPADLSPGDLTTELTLALSGTAMEPQVPTIARTALQQAAALIDDRLLGLLALLGAEAIAAEPGLPLRLLQTLPLLPPLDSVQRRLLGLRLRPGNAGRAQGGGLGTERTGISLQGDLRTLLPSQLTLPEPVLQSRARRGELLYRARSGREPPRLRPLVLVLDISPSCFGAIEATSRLAAHILAASLCQARVPALLLTAGGTERVYPLAAPADLLELWTRRSLEAANGAMALRLAQTLRPALGDSSLEPLIVLLSHPWFGGDAVLQPIPYLRGLFVQYPGQKIRPVLADCCERWESVPGDSGIRLLEPLSRLLE